MCDKVLCLETSILSLNPLPFPTAYPPVVSVVVNNRRGSMLFLLCISSGLNLSENKRAGNKIVTLHFSIAITGIYCWQYCFLLYCTAKLLKLGFRHAIT